MFSVLSSRYSTISLYKKNAQHTVCREISWRWLLSKLHIIVSSKHMLQPSGCQSKTVASSSDCSHSELYLSHYIPPWFQWRPFSSFPFTCPFTLHTTPLSHHRPDATERFTEKKINKELYRMGGKIQRFFTPVVISAISYFMSVNSYICMLWFVCKTE